MKIGFRTWILLIVLVLALLAISPSFKSGVEVKSVSQNSELYDQGLRSGEVLKNVNGQNIGTVEDYSEAITLAFNDRERKRFDLVTEKQSYVIFTNQSPEITVEDMKKTNIETGLDLRGGSRALVQADQPLTEQELQDLIEVSRNRFNVFGLSDVQINGVTDLDGNKFMLIEIAGASPEDLENLIAKQGKFEAKIGNKTVFTGGEDINDVCRNDATCAGVTSCTQVQGGQACNFAFTLFLSAEAAKRHADITEEIPLDPTGQYLEESLYLYIDGEEVDSLLISSNLKGQLTSEISIQGSGQGSTRDEAITSARENMNQLQTVLITGSLPYKLEIVKLDSISPTLGADFTRALIIAGIAAIVLVSLVVFVRYRKIKAAGALLLTAFSELVIILGVASLINWNLDLPSIAGILATIGTGVDQQIVILDEAVRERVLSVKQRIKRALFVIFTAYFTSVVALLPLWWAGAGLFKGFAFTTIIGITAGVLITRPAFAEIIGKIEE